nr:hypothetical protein B0A51_00392 [Rachicladosporium sp. CCFEE 5018]
MPHLSAVLRVFGITELAESILQQDVTQRQLLELKLLNHYFHDLITRSMVLRKQMFFVHAHNGTDPSKGIKLNPMLVHLAKPLPHMQLSLIYGDSNATDKRWTFKFTLDKSATDIAALVDTSKALLESSAIKRSLAATTKIASAPLKLRGEINVSYSRPSSRRSITYVQTLTCDFDIDPAATLGGLVAIFAVKLQKLVMEHAKEIGHELLRSEEGLQHLAGDLAAFQARRVARTKR